MWYPFWRWPTRKGKKRCNIVSSDPTKKSVSLCSVRFLLNDPSFLLVGSPYYLLIIGCATHVYYAFSFTVSHNALQLQSSNCTTNTENIFYPLHPLPLTSLVTSPSLRIVLHSCGFLIDLCSFKWVLESFPNNLSFLPSSSSSARAEIEGLFVGVRPSVCLSRVFEMFEVFTLTTKDFHGSEA